MRLTDLVSGADLDLFASGLAVDIPRLCSSPWWCVRCSCRAPPRRTPPDIPLEDKTPINREGGPAWLTIRSTTTTTTTPRCRGTCTTGSGSTTTRSPGGGTRCSTAGCSSASSTSRLSTSPPSGPPASRRTSSAEERALEIQFAELRLIDMGEEKVLRIMGEPKWLEMGASVFRGELRLVPQGGRVGHEWARSEHDRQPLQEHHRPGRHARRHHQRREQRRDAPQGRRAAQRQRDRARRRVRCVAARRRTCPASRPTARRSPRSRIRSPMTSPRRPRAERRRPRKAWSEL